MRLLALFLAFAVTALTVTGCGSCPKKKQGMACCSTSGSSNVAKKPAP